MCILGTRSGGEREHVSGLTNAIPEKNPQKKKELEVAAKEDTSQDYLMQFLHGAGQEKGLRASTENVALSVGLGAACALLQGTQALESHLNTVPLKSTKTEH